MKVSYVPRARSFQTATPLSAPLSLTHRMQSSHYIELLPEGVDSLSCQTVRRNAYAEIGHLSAFRQVWSAGAVDFHGVGWPWVYGKTRRKTESSGLTGTTGHSNP